ncbi:DUF397 domain-containing protein [Nocardiopsis alba]|uniref:DUF397 domain-containing protein n=1 Tax=Nocardiopsis TaxID=2013 RepID=UPI002DBD9A53|nr:DUF397 domain-containing protein [Nocardiopsis sp. LDBS1602]MEC3891831.1 DUF397 domain-containing protein [Nocardiopsis sp. LDBS1602]
MDLNFDGWRTSTYSAASSNNCAEVALATTAAAVRDTKNRDQGHLAFHNEEWMAFLHAISRVGTTEG